MNAEFALARVEGIHLLRNPFVWLAVIPSAMWVNEAKAGLDRRDAEDLVYLLNGYSLVLPGFAAVVVTILAVLRSRLAHADDLLDTLPVGRAQRSVAHGWSTAANALYGAVIIAAAYLYMWPSSTPGFFSDDSAAQNGEDGHYNRGEAREQQRVSAQQVDEVLSVSSAKVSCFSSVAVVASQRACSAAMPSCLRFHDCSRRK